MRRNVVAVGLVACGLTGLSSAPALAATRPALAQAAEQPGILWPVRGGVWLRDEMMERLTVPLGPYRFNPGVLNTGGASDAGMFAAEVGRGR